MKILINFTASPAKASKQNIQEDEPKERTAPTQY